MKSSAAFCYSINYGHYEATRVDIVTAEMGITSLTAFFRCKPIPFDAYFVLFSLDEDSADADNMVKLVLFDELCKLIETIYLKVMLPRISLIFTTGIIINAFFFLLFSFTRQIVAIFKMIDYFGKICFLWFVIQSDAEIFSHFDL